MICKILYFIPAVIAYFAVDRLLSRYFTGSWWKQPHSQSQTVSEYHNFICSQVVTDDVSESNQNDTKETSVNDSSGTESAAESIEDHDVPQENACYRHTETDEPVEYLSRDEETYYFSVNGGGRMLELRAEDWPMYRDQLVFEGWRL